MNLTDVFLMSKRSLMERLFECVSSYDIFCSFIGEDVKVGDSKSNTEDNHPTFILFVPKTKTRSILKTLPGKEVTYLSL
jgi:hypothetical protein